MFYIFCTLRTQCLHEKISFSMLLTFPLPLFKVICCRLLNECILPYIYQKKPSYLSIWPIWSLQSTDISNINIQYLILIYYLIFCETFVKYSIFHILYLIFDTLRISYLFIMKCLVLCILLWVGLRLKCARGASSDLFFF